MYDIINIFIASTMTYYKGDGMSPIFEFALSLPLT